MEWQITCRPCSGNLRTKEPHKRRGPIPGRSSNARFSRGLPFGNLRLCRPLGYLRQVLSVFFPLLLSWCLLYFCVFTFVNSGYYVSRYMPWRVLFVRSELNAWPLDGAFFAPFVTLDCGPA